MLERLKSPFLYSFAPIIFYITSPYYWFSYRDWNYRFHSWGNGFGWFLFFVSIIFSFVFGKKIDSFLRKRINKPEFISFLYGTILMLITTPYYILDGHRFYFMAKIFFIFILSLSIWFFTASNNKNDSDCLR